MDNEIGKSTSDSAPVYLVPWDPNSQEHVDHMRLQRIACGWKVEEVEGWRDPQRKGHIGLHWVVLHPDHPKTPSRLEKHFAVHPNEVNPLRDTCKMILGRPHKCDPLIPLFSPVGHIALDSVTSKPELETSLSNGVLSLMNFYISTALQSLGLGGVSLKYCEIMAKEEFGAKTITLETISNEECRPDSPRRIAMKRPIPTITNQDWYSRRGYRVYASKEVAWVDIDETGKEWPQDVCRTDFVSIDSGIGDKDSKAIFLDIHHKYLLHEKKAAAIFLCQSHSMSESTFLPACPGPQLLPFKDRDAKIQWGPRIDEDRAGESGTEGFVFKVKIKSKTYAIKVFRFYDPEEDRYYWEPYLGASYPVEKVIFYLDPFYAECRAFGRIQQAYANREIHHRQVLTVKCHGYMFLSKQDQLKLEKRGCDFGSDFLHDKIRGASGGNGRVRAIVKDLEPDTGPLDAKNIRTAFARVCTVNKLGIYHRDVRAQNFVNCRLVDFGTSWTEPHEIFTALGDWEIKQERLTDVVMFQEMIDDERIKTRLKVFDDSGYGGKLRSWTRPPTIKRQPDRHSVDPLTDANASRSSYGSSRHSRKIDYRKKKGQSRVGI
ncbi:hypothetical protein O1611_g2345 [Lasiodiplodia mahajangana]|uniref:Uncharacterized protein n=1 Tax=Lasiodiplodia mahajangana TaxID=1108764 RepID=A0ACC2JV57_9PEZI|nr:hypothetical protein O1611_g2345 [Lasiodiplodia mahajangana]